MRKKKKKRVLVLKTALLDAHAEEHLAVAPGCKPRAPDAKERGRCLENRPWANNGLRTFKELVKKPFAWVSKDALGTKLARPGAQDCLP